MSTSLSIRGYRVVPFLLLFVLVHCGPTPSVAQVADAASQIAGAVQAAPTEHREAATVYGFRGDGTLVTLRQGSGELICLADNPTKEGWSVACYHKSLEPYMSMGRDLRAEGITDAAVITKRRFEAADSGTLAMPEKPALLYVMTGEDYDSATDRITKPYVRYVIYSPYATPETTGLGTTPETAGQPWLMFPGTPGAHIMVSPPVVEE